MDKEDNAKLKKASQRTILWVIISILALGAATLAWFTFSSYTNVTPMGGAIGSGGVELLISNYEDRDFGEYIDLVIDGSVDNMKPVSTADLETWSTSVSNGTNGISDKFKNITETIDNNTLYGKLYLKAEGGKCDVYFNEGNISMGTDEQLISSCRMGVRLNTQSGGQQTLIWKLDSLTNAAAASSQATMAENDVVIASVDDSGAASTVTDPSEDIDLYTGTYESDKTYPGMKPICTLNDGEVVCFDYRIYMEGCDENCFNDAQDRQLDIKLGFVGVENKD